MSARLFSGWGVRTLADGEGRYNPIGYHVGTVSPFENSIIAWGLRRYGFKDEAARVAEGILGAAQYFEGCLPEAFGGYPRQMTKYPVQYPTACSPQAWSTGAPLLLRALLGMEPVGDNLVVDPALPVSKRGLAGTPRHPGAMGPDRRVRTRPHRHVAAAFQPGVAAATTQQKIARIQHLATLTTVMWPIVSGTVLWRTVLDAEVR